MLRDVLKEYYINTVIDIRKVRNIVHDFGVQ